MLPTNIGLASRATRPWLVDIPAWVVRQALSTWSHRFTMDSPVMCDGQIHLSIWIKTATMCKNDCPLAFWIQNLHQNHGLHGKNCQKVDLWNPTTNHFLSIICHQLHLPRQESNCCLTSPQVICLTKGCRIICSSAGRSARDEIFRTPQHWVIWNICYICW